MKPFILLTAVASMALTTSLFAETPKFRYITKKSTPLYGRSMNNTVVNLDAGGIKFVVPPGAIDASLMVEVYKEEGTLIVPEGTPGNSIARIAAKTDKFSGLVEIHIPITNPEKIPVAYAVDKSDEWEKLKFKEVSADKSTAIYLTQKPVTVAWVTPP
jgi:hypothetical protein